MHHRQDLKMKEELAHLQIEWGEERLRTLELQPSSDHISIRLVGGFTSEIEQTS